MNWQGKATLILVKLRNWQGGPLNVYKGNMTSSECAFQKKYVIHQYYLNSKQNERYLLCKSQWAVSKYVQGYIYLKQKLSAPKSKNNIFSNPKCKFLKYYNMICSDISNTKSVNDNENYNDNNNMYINIPEGHIISQHIYQQSRLAYAAQFECYLMILINYI